MGADADCWSRFRRAYWCSTQYVVSIRRQAAAKKKTILAAFFGANAAKTHQRWVRWFNERSVALTRPTDGSVMSRFALLSAIQQFGQNLNIKTERWKFEIRGQRQART